MMRGTANNTAVLYFIKNLKMFLGTISVQNKDAGLESGER